MNRKSKRELQRSVEDLEPESSDVLGWAEALEWLQHVEQHGPDAAPIAAYFGRDEVTWEAGLADLIQDIVDDNPGLEAYTPAEVIGLRFMSPSVGEAIGERRVALAERGGDQGR